MKKRITLLISLLCIGGIVFGISVSEPASAATSAYPVTITDTAGNEIVVEKPLERIVVAYYGCAEVMRSLKAEDKIVGVGKTITTRPAYFPKLSALPSTGNTTFNEAELILKLAPDAVIIGTGSRNTETRDKLLSVKPELVVIQMAFYKPEYHVEEVEKLGTILGKEQEADAYLDFYTGLLELIGSRVDALSDDVRPKVYLESTQDYKTGAPGSSWHPKILSAGGFNVYGDEKVSLPEVTAESVVQKNPDLIFKVSGWNMATFGGYGVDSPDEMIAAKDTILQRPAWNNIAAVQNDQVWIMYNDVLGGPGYFIGVAYLARIIHPELFADLDPQEAHQEYLSRFQGLDYDLQQHGVFVYPKP
jgi:iron complex transport system substrate-binding protein